MCQVENHENNTVEDQSCINITIHRNNQSLISTKRISDLQSGYTYIIKDVAEVESNGEITVLTHMHGDTQLFVSPTTSAQMITTKQGESHAVYRKNV